MRPMRLDSDLEKPAWPRIYKGFSVQRSALVRRIVLLVLAGICLVLGLLSLPLPLPAGLFFNLTALALLLMASTTLQRWFRGFRSRFPKFHRALRSIERHLPEMMRRALNGGRLPRTQSRQ